MPARRKKTLTPKTSPKKSRQPKRAGSVSTGTLDQYTEDGFPIVAAAGSGDGGFQAFVSLLKGIEDSPGAAFIYIDCGAPAERREPNRRQLEAATPMRVVFIDAPTPIECATVYIAWNGSGLTLDNSVLTPASQATTGTQTADHFFAALAEDQGPRVIGVVLSGTVSDGAIGTRVIKAEGGLTFAQNDTARSGQMPRNAAALGVVDFILPPKAIAEEVNVLCRNTLEMVQKDPTRFRGRDLLELYRRLLTAHQVDFRQYKINTVERRIRRRMALRKTPSLREYIQYIDDNPAELNDLYAEMLIHVTGFFRDPDVFQALQQDIIPALLYPRENNNPLRIWVAGCATGEEVYSLAIAFLEVAADRNFESPIQIFGTDISEQAIDTARAGFYPESALADVSPERLRKFFRNSDGGYRVARTVRDCCIFARQNVAQDPPFSKLDLVSCRNVMIYLGPALQRKVMGIFHYALRPDGFLLLGNSETPGAFTEALEVVDRKNKIYRKRKGSVSPHASFSFDHATPRLKTPEHNVSLEEPKPSAVFRDADRVLLSRLAPCGVIIDEKLDIVQFRGRTSAFFEPPPGTATLNVLKMAREGLTHELRTAINASRKDDGPVKREGIHIANDHGTIVVNIDVLPFSSNGGDRYQVILFQDAVIAPQPRRKKTAEESEPRRIARLKRELEATREYLQSFVEEQEVTNEELRSANEEIQSSNEELQSTNEELETAKEELQSSNEELATLNEELENSNRELRDAYNDLTNLLTALEIPILMVDSQVRIRRFNPSAQRTLNLIASDIGRPMQDLKMSVLTADIGGMIDDVINTLEVKELETIDARGRRYSLRIRPYKTTDNVIAGAVLVLIDLEEFLGGVIGRKRA
jgi:two-component system CheB/CheR fusion protein